MLPPKAHERWHSPLWIKTQYAASRFVPHSIHTAHGIACGYEGERPLIFAVDSKIFFFDGRLPFCFVAAFPSMASYVCVPNLVDKGRIPRAKLGRQRGENCQTCCYGQLPSCENKVRADLHMANNTTDVDSPRSAHAGILPHRRNSNLKLPQSITDLPPTIPRFSPA